MNLTSKETKFLSILNETRVVNGKFLEGFNKRIKDHFVFKNEDLVLSIKKFKSEGFLTELVLGKDESMYFFTDKVKKDMLDLELNKVRMSI